MNSTSCVPAWRGLSLRAGQQSLTARVEVRNAVSQPDSGARRPRAAGGGSGGQRLPRPLRPARRRDVRRLRVLPRMSRRHRHLLPAHAPRRGECPRFGRDALRGLPRPRQPACGWRRRGVHHHLATAAGARRSRPGPDVQPVPRQHRRPLERGPARGQGRDLRRLPCRPGALRRRREADRRVPQQGRVLPAVPSAAGDRLPAALSSPRPRGRDLLPRLP